MEIHKCIQGAIMMVYLYTTAAQLKKFIFLMVKTLCVKGKIATKNNLHVPFRIFSHNPIVMKKAFLFILLVSVSMSCQPTDSNDMLRHVVSFKFSPEASSAQVNALVEAFQNLPNDIPQIKAFEWGENNSPEGVDKGMTHIFLLSFADEKARDEYLVHPDHVAFGDTHGGIIEDLVVVDYLAQ